jgi:predicted phosphoribosyltransferase
VTAHERSGVFVNRSKAGEELGRALLALGLEPPILVLGLPRGGVPVALEVARALQAPLDVLVVRKVGAPWQPELAIGAVASGGIIVREHPHWAAREAWDESFAKLVAREQAEVARRERAFRGERPPLDLHGKTTVLVDDGLATGATMLAAIRAARAAGAARVVAAAPVAARDTRARIATEADDVLILQTPALFFAVGQWYEDFRQVEDHEVRTLLAQTADRGAAQTSTLTTPK